ncbi:hypothetical protein D9611_009612 [Ephemerocybe angulata]|uniref:ATP-dependent DNA helicase n=1 Tax=Ephemerocybe angulata TaxID=980116 RepID=A0A8H5FGP6_9AGAR|nr:hypothetical protein D9611_009612 [Tulosesus angulatus]
MLIQILTVPSSDSTSTICVFASHHTFFPASPPHVPAQSILASAFWNRSTFVFLRPCARFLEVPSGLTGIWLVIGSQGFANGRPRYSQPSLQRCIMDARIVALCDQVLTACNLATHDVNLNAILALHALPVTSHTHDQRVELLLNHTLNGLCLTSSGTFCTLFHTYPSHQLLSSDACVYLNQQTSLPVRVLRKLCDSLGIMAGVPMNDEGWRQTVSHILSSYPEGCVPVNAGDLSNLSFFFTDYFWRKTGHLELAYMGRLHGIALAGDRAYRRSALFQHVATGECVLHCRAWEGCHSVLLSTEIDTSEDSLQSANSFVTAVMDCALAASSPTAFITPLLALYGVDPPPDTPIDALLQTLRNIRQIATRTALALDMREAMETMAEREKVMSDIAAAWPPIISTETKENLIKNFRNATSTERLLEATCAICGISVLRSKVSSSPPHHLPLDLLKIPANRTGYSIPAPLADHATLAPYLLEPAGVLLNNKGETSLNVCQKCREALQKKRLPCLALANSLHLGKVPPELDGLTQVEESLIALCRAKCMIVQLQFDEAGSMPSAVQQRALRGNIITFPQRPDFLPPLLPPSIDDILERICVVFIGSKLPDPSWFLTHAKPLLVRSNKVRTALEWLKKNNPLYSEVQINEDCLRALPTDTLLPFHYDNVPEDTRRDAATSRYESNLGSPEASDGEICFSSIVVSNVGREASSRELRAAALRHLKAKRGAALSMPHDDCFANEFDNPDLFPSLYPTLFPYGSGGFEDPRRQYAVSFASHVQHVLSLTDSRFRHHGSFLFTAFNMIQRRSLLLNVAFKTRHSWFRALADGFNLLTSETVGKVASRMTDDTFFTTPHTEEEKKVISLMSHVNSVTRKVEGTSSSRLSMRNEIRATTSSFGVPSFFITINPADVYNPIVKLLAGNSPDYDIDSLLPEQVPRYWDQAKLVAQNPFVAAKFFDLYSHAFVDELLAYDRPTMERGYKPRMGVLGYTKAFYACVEAQGRGTLHWHMVVWIEGALNPNDLRIKFIEAVEGFQQQFTAYIEDCISSAVPEPPMPDVTVASDTHHPCSVRGVNFRDPNECTFTHREKDLYNLVKTCQVHAHRATCFKYWKGPPAPKECRFNLGDAACVPESTVDPNTGEFTFKHTDGNVNTFNDTILEAVRNNMDIKPITSGDNAKAITFYITDYISKTQLKSHVAYAALETAVKKLETVEKRSEIDSEDRSKNLLQKCAYELLSRQELSGPQVASFLMDYPDHFSSHEYRCLFWTAAESFIEECLPSPECYGEGVDLPSVPPALNVPAPQAPPSLPVIDDDVIMEVDDNANITPRASQLRDYVFRGKLVEPLSYWDFVARASKVKFKALNARAGVTPSNIAELEDMWAPYNILTAPAASRPVCRFLPEHDESETCFTQICHPLHAFLPVPIGPALPRRDRPATRAKYCRMMLVLFKPWRTVHELRGSASSWEEAFLAFQGSSLYTSRIDQILTNMQVFHECKDSRDEHFRDRRKRLGNFGRQFEGRDEMSIREEDEGLGPAGVQEEEAFFEFLKASKTMGESEMRTKRAAEYLEIAARCGLLDAADMSVYERMLDGKRSATSHMHIDISSAGDGMEQVWKHIYDDKRMRVSKKRKRDDDDAQGSTDPDPEKRQCHAPQAVPQIAGPPSRNLDCDELRNAIALKYTLNEKQALAFRVISKHVLEEEDGPLRMYIAGPAGTGKTTVINAVKDLFSRIDGDSKVVLACYMGIAARHIGGVTLHSALNLRGMGNIKVHGDVHQALIKFWDDKDWLIIDEVSMISLTFLHQINESLQHAKESEKPFGGINVIFLGDFAQLPPVAQNPLYKTLDPFRCSTTDGQKQVFGKLLWHSVDTVVSLDETHRQAGAKNERFRELLSRLREGTCTNDDYTLLQSRVLGPDKAHLFATTDSPWRGCPIVVSDNATKDALNESCAVQFALDNNVDLHWYYASDSRLGRAIENDDVLEELQTRDSGATKGRLGRIPLCIGMPVLVAQNWDVRGGVANGSRGTVSQVRFKWNRKGQRVLTSCVVRIADSTDIAMPGLDKHEMPILSDSVEMSFNNKWAKTSKSAQRKQVAVVPAFAMTAHRAQGQTLSHVIVDLYSCRGTEAAYVMVSRATSLDGLLVYRDFDKKKIMAGQKPDVLLENHRLHMKSLSTIVKHAEPGSTLWANAEAALKSIPNRATSAEVVDRYAITSILKDTSITDPNKTKNRRPAATAVDALQQETMEAFRDFKARHPPPRRRRIQRNEGRDLATLLVEIASHRPPLSVVPTRIPYLASRIPHLASRTSRTARIPHPASHISHPASHLALAAPTRPPPLNMFPTRDLSLFWKNRRANGVYERMTTKISDLGDTFIGNNIYKKDFVTFEAWGGNKGFKAIGGRDVDRAFTFFGEITHPKHGTALSASGNHIFVSKDGGFVPLTDESRVKDRPVIGNLTYAPPPLQALFENQIATLNDIRVEDEEKEQRLGEDPFIHEWVKASDTQSEDAVADLIILTLGNKFVLPGDNQASKAKASVSPRKRIRRQEVPAEDRSDAAADESGPPPPESGSSSGPSSGGDSVHIGAFYEPSTMPDFSGAPCFDLRHKKLIQADVRDVNGRLIQPKEYLTALRPGTVILAKCTLHKYEMPPSAGYRRGRKIYQLNAISTRVIAESEHPVEEIFPISPPAAAGVIATPVTADGTDLSPDPFKDFDLGVSPVAGPSSPAPAAARPSSPLPASSTEAGSAADPKGKGKGKGPAHKGKPSPSKRNREDADMDDDFA